MAQRARQGVSEQAIDVVAILPERRVLVADATPRLRVLDLARGIEVASIPLRARILAVRVAADGRRVVTLPVIRQVVPPALYDISRGELVRELIGHPTQV